MSQEDTADSTLYRPNIVYVHCHDLGRHLGCYGRDVHSPNIDSIAENGVRFDNCFASAPQCSPSRGSAMTGMYPHNNGLMGLVHRGWELDKEVQALPMYLRDAGYETHEFGFSHVSSSPTRLGFQESHGDSGSAGPVSECFDDNSDLLDGEKPVFASVGFHEPHTPFRRDVPDEVYERYDPESVTVPEFLPDTQEVRENLADYQALISGVVDPAVGRIQDAIDEAGVADETLLVFTTDHGMPFPGAKTNPTDAGLEIALLVQHPGLEGGRSRDELLSNVDVLPTLLEFAGEAAPANVDGRSFRPLLTGDEYEPRDRIFAEQTWHGGKLTPFRAVRTREFKYVQNYLNRARGMGGSAHFPEEECYDLTTDPHEEHNLASDRKFGEGFSPNSLPWQDDASNPDPEHLDDITELRSHLHEWLTESGDSLVDGYVPIPTHDHGRVRQ